MSTLVEREIHFGVASDDLVKQAIYRFRYDTLVRGLNRSYSGSDHSREWLKDAWDASGIQIYAKADESIIAGLRLNFADDVDYSHLSERYHMYDFQAFLPYKSFFLSRLVVASERRGSGTLAGLVREAYRVGQTRDQDFCFMHCRPQIVPIMQHMGCVPCGPAYEDEHAGPVTPMVICLKHAEYLHSVNSPMADLVPSGCELHPSVLHFNKWRISHVFE